MNKLDVRVDNRDGTFAREVHWTLSINCPADREKIDLLCRRGILKEMTTICGRPVCWTYELHGAHDRDGNPVLVTAFIGTGTK